MAIISNYAAWKSGICTFLIIAAGLIGVILNIFFIFVVTRSKFLKRPANLFLLNIAIVDLIGVIFWIIPSVISSATWEWHLGNAICEFHGFIGMFCLSMNMNTFTAIAVEKFFKLVIPSRHRFAFENYTIIFIIIGSLWLYCMVLSFMPLIGWSEFLFYNYQIQCAPDYLLAESFLHFFTIMAFCFPVVLSLVLYIILFIKIKALNKKNTTKDGKFVLQEKKNAPGDSYAEKMKIQTMKFQKSNKMKKQQKGSKQNKSNDDDDKCFHSDDSVVEVSDEEYFQDYQDYHEAKTEKKKVKDRQRVFTYKQHYFFMALTMAITMAVYAALWVPFLVVNYIWLNSDAVTEGSYLFSSTITFFGLSYKPLIYVTNKQVRGSYARAFQCRRKKTVLYGGGGEARNETTLTETRTVREVHHTEEVVETTTTSRNYSEEKTDPPSRQPTIAWEEK